MHHKNIAQTILNHWFLLFMLILLNSCMNMHKVTYLNSKKDESEFTNNKPIEYTIQPSDELAVLINSLDDKQTALASGNAPGENSQAQTSPSPQAQKVDENGFIELPIVGKINVKDKTTDQVASILKESYKNILNMPMASVKIINKTFTIIGEVKKPGLFPFANDHISIFDALSLAGDITEFGTLQNVVYLRTENNKTIKTVINLSEANIITSPYYYIRPNDVIYIKPRLGKYSSFKNSSIPILIGMLSSVLLLYTTFNN